MTLQVLSCKNVTYDDPSEDGQHMHQDSVISLNWGLEVDFGLTIKHVPRLIRCAQAEQNLHRAHVIRDIIQYGSLNCYTCIFIRF